MEKSWGTELSGLLSTTWSHLRKGSFSLLSGAWPVNPQNSVGTSPPIPVTYSMSSIDSTPPRPGGASPTMPIFEASPEGQYFW